MTFGMIADVYTVTRQELEKECVYLMKKRKVLEDVIRIREKTIVGLRNGVKNRDRMLEQHTIQIQRLQQITNQTLDRVNKEKDDYLQEIQRIRAEIKELKKGVD